VATHTEVLTKAQLEHLLLDHLVLEHLLLDLGTVRHERLSAASWSLFSLSVLRQRLNASIDSI